MPQDLCSPVRGVGADGARGVVQVRAYFKHEKKVAYPGDQWYYEVVPADGEEEDEEEDEPPTLEAGMYASAPPPASPV